MWMLDIQNIQRLQRIKQHMHWCTIQQGQVITVHWAAYKCCGQDSTWHLCLLYGLGLCTLSDRLGFSSLSCVRAAVKPSYVYRSVLNYIVDCWLLREKPRQVGLGCLRNQRLCVKTTIVQSFARSRLTDPSLTHTGATYECYTVGHRKTRPQTLYTDRLLALDNVHDMWCSDMMCMQTG